MINTDFLNALRRAQNLKLKDIARRAGISPGYIGTIFSGRLTKVSEKTAENISKSLRAPVKILFPDYLSGTKKSIESIKKENRRMMGIFVKTQRKIAFDTVKTLSKTLSSISKPASLSRKKLHNGQPRAH